MKCPTICVIATLLAALAGQVQASAAEDDGEVRLPLNTYNHLVDQSRHESRPAPAAYAIGIAKVSVAITEHDKRSAARVHATVRIEVLENQWTLVPILPSGTALVQARANGAPVQLVNGPDGLAFSSNQAGVVKLELRYGVEARRSDTGFVLPLPVPRAAATDLRVSHPRAGIDIAVVPAADMQIRSVKGGTQLAASVPSTSSIMVTWRMLSELPFAVSRARYHGELRGDALLWQARFDVEIFGAEPATIAPHADFSHPRGSAHRR